MHIYIYIHTVCYNCIYSYYVYITYLHIMYIYIFACNIDDAYKYVYVYEIQ